MKIGDKLYRRVKNQIEEYTINSIGRKYIKVNENCRWEIDKTTLTRKDNEFSQFRYQFYLSKEDIEQEILTEEARYVLKAMLDINKLELEQINSIIEIIRK